MRPVMCYFKIGNTFWIANIADNAALSQHFKVSKDGGAADSLPAEGLIYRIGALMLAGAEQVV